MRLKIFCGFLLCIFACSKVNQWKYPTSIGFELALSATEFLNGDLVLQGGHLELGDFIFDGNREQGGDVYFSAAYEKTVQVPLQSSAIEAMTFDIPKGIYNAMTVYLGEEEHPSTLILEGKLVLNNADPVFVQLEIDGVEEWPIVGKNQARQQQPLELTADKINASIVLQTHRWIKEEQRTMWEMAEIMSINGRATILINSKTNLELYQSISKLYAAHLPYVLVES